MGVGRGIRNIHEEISQIFEGNSGAKEETKPAELRSQRLLI